MLNILICCASGSGTSMMMKLTVEKACKAAGLKEFSVKHCPIAEGVSSAKSYNLVITSPAFAKNFDNAKNAGVKVGLLKNPLSTAEVDNILKENGFVE